MDNIAIAYRNNRDRAIRKNHCQFIFQFQLLPPLIDKLLTTGIFGLPDEARKTLDEFLTDDIKEKCVGDGLKCVSYQPNTLFIDVTVKYVAGNCMLVVPWSFMFKRCEVKEMAVMSMWGYYEEGLPRFIFRLDGYAKEGEDLPPLTDMEVVDDIEKADESNKEAGKLGCLSHCCPIM